LLDAGKALGRPRGFVQQRARFANGSKSISIRFAADRRKPRNRLLIQRWFVRYRRTQRAACGNTPKRNRSCGKRCATAWRE
jgi:hypothetical protein